MLNNVCVPFYKNQSEKNLIRCCSLTGRRSRHLLYFIEMAFTAAIIILDDSRIQIIGGEAGKTKGGKFINSVEKSERKFRKEKKNRTQKVSSEA